MPLSSTSPIQLSLFDFENFDDVSTSHPQNQIPNILQAKNKKYSVSTQGYSIEYVLERVKRRSIGLFIDEGFLRIRAPRWVTLKEIEGVILEKRKWIIRKFSEQKQTPQKQKTLWENDGYFYYMGEKINIICSTERTSIPLLDTDEKNFLLPLLPTTSSETIKEKITDWLKQKARTYYERQLSEYAKQLDVSYSSFSISNATTLWGICNAKGRILLNWRLISLPRNIIDYVIVHELSHLREMNHSPRFWANVESVIPNYKVVRKTLNAVSLSQLCASY